jgi:SAM-dependent methyltransferase
VTNPTIIDPDLENKHRALWALGDYRTIAAELVAPLGPELAAATAVRTGERVLDVAAGTGNAAFAAAERGADVIASDLSPELLEKGRTQAIERGLDVTFREASAEALPFDDGEFDTVLSCIGVMFAPHHQRSADELIRVCRPGGTIGVLSWTPAGFIGRLFATMKPYAPAPMPGVQAPPLWGDEDYVRNLFGARVTKLETRRAMLRVDRFADGAAFRDYFKAYYGPTISAYQAIAGDPDRVAALDSDLATLGDDQLAGSSVMGWEYLVVTAHRT